MFLSEFQYCKIGSTSTIFVDGHGLPQHIFRLRSHRHEYEYEYESGFPFTGCRSLVQASLVRVKRSWSLVRAKTRNSVAIMFCNVNVYILLILFFVCLFFLSTKVYLHTPSKRNIILLL